MSRYRYWVRPCAPARSWQAGNCRHVSGAVGRDESVICAPWTGADGWPVSARQLQQSHQSYRSHQLIQSFQSRLDLPVRSSLIVSGVPPYPVGSDLFCIALPSASRIAPIASHSASHCIPSSLVPSTQSSSAASHYCDDLVSCCVMMFRCISPSLFSHHRTTHTLFVVSRHPLWSQQICNLASVAFR